MSEQPANVTASPWVSITFWVCLFAAATAYAAVALAPKVFDYVELRRTYVTEQIELVELERRNRYLDRVVAALESDPAFAEELARADLDAARPGEERIPVDRELTLVPDERGPTVAPPTAPWYLPTVRALATEKRVRFGLLGAAAFVTIAAFAVLHDGNADAALGAGRLFGRSTHWLRNRYRDTPS